MTSNADSTGSSWWSQLASLTKVTQSHAANRAHSFVFMTVRGMCRSRTTYPNGIFGPV